MHGAERRSTRWITAFSLLAYSAGCGGRSDVAPRQDAGAPTGGASGTRAVGGSSTGGVSAKGGTASVARGGSGTGGAIGWGGVTPAGGSIVQGGTKATGGQAIQGGTAPGSGGQAVQGGTGGTLVQGGSGGASTGGVAVQGGTGGTEGWAGGGGISAIAGTSGTPATGGGGTSAGAGGQAGETPMAGAAGEGGHGGAAGGNTSIPCPNANRTEWYVDPVYGSDEGQGTAQHPFQTLSHAASCAQADQTLWLSDGLYDATTEPQFQSSVVTVCGEASGIVFAPGLQIRAVHSGAARVLAASEHALCVSGGVIEGLSLECTSAARPLVETAQGSLQIHQTSVTNCGSAGGIDVAGSALVTLSPGELSDYSGQPNRTLAVVREQGSLTVQGGKVSVTESAFMVRDAAQLRLAGVSIASQWETGLASYGISLGAGTPELTLEAGSVVSGFSCGILSNAESPQVAIDNATFQGNANAVILQRPGDTGTITAVFSNTVVSDNLSVGLQVTGSFDLSVTDTQLSRNGSPSIIAGGTGTLLLERVELAAGYGGVIISGGGDTDGIDARVRNVSVSDMQNFGFALSGGPANGFDLGTVDSPGGNVLSGNAGNTTGGANLAYTLGANTIVYAVGNTWDPNVQDADANGHYGVEGAGATLEVLEGAGPNYYAGSGNAGVVRLAENPP